MLAKLKLAEKEKQEAMESNPDPPKPQLAAIESQLVASPSQQPQDRLVNPESYVPPCRRLEGYEKRNMWVNLYNHIALNVKRGVYHLEPVKKGQCVTCRRIIGRIRQTAIHQENCRLDMYEKGCPCGFLTISTGNLGGHTSSCRIASVISREGIDGYLPYVSPEWRRCLLLNR